MQAYARGAPGPAARLFGSQEESRLEAGLRSRDIPPRGDRSAPQANSSAGPAAHGVDPLGQARRRPCLIHRIAELSRLLWPRSVGRRSVEIPLAKNKPRVRGRTAARRTTGFPSILSASGRGFACRGDAGPAPKEGSAVVGMRSSRIRKRAAAIGEGGKDGSAEKKRKCKRAESLCPSRRR